MWCVSFNLSWCILCVVLELCECVLGKVMSSAAVKVACSQGKLNCMEPF